MKNYIKHDEWQIIEEGFDPSLNKISESIFSLGNGRMGHRANFEETYTGESLSGSYIAGVYYPDKTRVGWWKNGYPEYFAKVLNAVNWIKLKITVNGEILDLNTAKVLEFRRVLDMKSGTLTRTFKATLKNKNSIQVEAIRFCSLVDDEAGAIRYTITPLNFDGEIKIESFLEGDVKNQDSNYDEQFWNVVDKAEEQKYALLTLETKKTAFWVSSIIHTCIWQDGNDLKIEPSYQEADKSVAQIFDVSVKKNQPISIYKYAVNVSSENYPKKQLKKTAIKIAKEITKKGFEQMLAEQAQAWKAKWEHGDVVIEGETLSGLIVLPLLHK